MSGAHHFSGRLLSRRPLPLAVAACAADGDAPFHGERGSALGPGGHEASLPLDAGGALCAEAETLGRRSGERPCSTWATYCWHVAGTTEARRSPRAGMRRWLWPDDVFRLDPPRTGRAVVRLAAEFAAIVAVRTSCADVCERARVRVASDVDGGAGAVRPAFRSSRARSLRCRRRLWRHEPAPFVSTGTSRAPSAETVMPIPRDLRRRKRRAWGRMLGDVRCSRAAHPSRPARAPYRLVATAEARGTITFAGGQSVSSNGGRGRLRVEGTRRGSKRDPRVTPSVVRQSHALPAGDSQEALLHVRRTCADSRTQLDLRPAEAALVPLGASIPVTAEETVYVRRREHAAKSGSTRRCDAHGGGLCELAFRCSRGVPTTETPWTATAATSSAASSSTRPPTRVSGPGAPPRSPSARTRKVRARRAAAGEELAGEQVRDVRSRWSSDVVYQVTSDIDGSSREGEGRLRQRGAIRTVCAGQSDLACAARRTAAVVRRAGTGRQRETAYFVVVDGRGRSQSGAFRSRARVQPSSCGTAVSRAGDRDDSASADGDGWLCLVPARSREGPRRMHDGAPP